MFRDKLKYVIYHQEKNEGPILRYAIATAIFRAELLDYVVSIDDDLFFKDKDTLENIWKQRKGRTHACFYGKIFREGKDYWSPVMGNGMWGITHGDRKDIKDWVSFL